MGGWAYDGRTNGGSFVSPSVTPFVPSTNLPLLLRRSVACFLSSFVPLFNSDECTALRSPLPFPPRFQHVNAREATDARKCPATEIISSLRAHLGNASGVA